MYFSATGQNISQVAYVLGRIHLIIAYVLGTFLLHFAYILEKTSIIVRLAPIYRSLLDGYNEDVEKYAKISSFITLECKTRYYKVT